MDTARTTPAEAVDAADGEPFIARARAHADSVLRPAALATDRDGVTATHVSRLAELGLLNHTAPAEFGGAAIGRAGDRRIHEILAGSCFNTWLVWAQHAPMVGRIASDHHRGAELPGLSRDVLAGRVLLGAAISDVRRFPEAFIAATRTGDGWTFSGTISWVSGWGLNTILVVAAVEASTQTVVTAFVPIGARVRAVHLELGAVGGSRTERVILDDVEVPESDVIGVQSLTDWRREDLGTAGDARPQYFGLAATVIEELDEDRHPDARRVARVWRPRVDALRADAYGLADEAKAAADERHRITERVATKVATGEALGTITRALVVARSGRGISRDDTAQLHARSALFLLVQGQSADVRDAQLARLAR
ncbi:acyl-CoA dehydrogenase family protein [Mycolicibacterium hodleri]|uniref:acyl-CoA dehydrogenase family protein n=1 Tax=Mycolicibacterium hodleri TaxID=49897 RepID=UPI0021F363D4|nr:acyl-CoA dehydrogenase family protein [Mycolicibacterium hodleri]